MLTFFPTHYKHWLTILIVAFISTLNQWLFADYVGNVEFVHAAVNNGEVWRLLTHAVWHTNLYHWGLNITGLVLLWALHGEHYSPLNTFILLCWCAVFSSAAVWLFAPHIDYYVGLSAALHGLFCYGAVADIRQKRYSGGLLILGIMVKLYFEQHQIHDNTASLIEANVAYDAHIFGAVAGIIYAIVYFGQQVLKKKNQ